MPEGRILVVDDEESVADSFRVALQEEGYTVRTAGSANRALAEVERADWDLAFVDLVLPDMDGLDLVRKLKARRPGLVAVVITAHGSGPKGFAAREAGAYDFLEKPHDMNPEKILTVVANALEHKNLLEKVAGGRTGYGGLVGRSGPMKKVFDLLDTVSSVDANVLIVGESGTGKELVANAIHYASPRADGQFIKINCAALPKDLIESELFGYAKGAFTGATGDKPGLFEEAHRGSLLLDEIAEMPADLQAKLLRVLEERKFRRLGTSRDIEVDFRLLSSTNRDPEAAVRELKLREDLYYRINTVTIRIPPLRERPEDLSLLAQHFLARFAEKHGKQVTGISADAYQTLLGYSWPGNVRELEHALERAVLVTRSGEITVGDLPETLTRGRQPGTAPAETPAAPTTLNLEERERQAILQALETTNWNKQAAAALLGLHRPTLYSKMRKHGIPQKRPA
ncbi:MAG TPA: sigma-54 dependent transcriptional regulator [Methylomirabilota bacterium]|jgi:DNA-binding NtrC family response regulator|nr:sigma-54 dependent transcriptional regulator [Methylomirabilota bacterium]